MEIEATYGNLYKHVGTKVWVCHQYYASGFSCKATRNVKPTEVKLHATQVQGKERPYRWRNLFSSYAISKKTGKELSKRISLFDNTSGGYPLRIFTTEEECKAAYAEICSDLLVEFEEWAE